VGKRMLSSEELEALGFVFSGKEMTETGEIRVRVINPDGSAYTMTMLPEDQPGGWQQSHWHQGVEELYCVQKGMIGYARLNNSGELVLSLHCAGDLFMTKPRTAHNVYMFSGAVIHTVKCGDCTHKGDWKKSIELDVILRLVTEDDLLALSGKE